MTRQEFETAINARGLLIDKPSRAEKDGAYLYECFDDAEGNEIGFISWHQAEATYTLR